MRRICLLALALVLAASAMGCSNAKLVAQKDQQIADLQAEIDMLEGNLSTERERTAALNADLEKALRDMREKEQMWLEERDGLTQITLDGEVTFSSGSANLTSKGKEMLNKIWDVLVEYPEKAVLIEGHTDNVPIAPKFQHNYKSNWELSSARAHTVLHYVRAKYNIDPKRIGAVGYGQHRPVADNATEAGRALNRRVVITVGGKLTETKVVP